LDLGALLPARPALERSRLAAEALGDPHALDDDRPVARLLVGQLAARAGTEPPATALARRELLARFGVRCDSLSCDVLALGLPALGGRRLARAVAAVEGRHLRLTLAQLQAEPVPGCAAPIGQVFCCENPVVLAAAEQRLWPRVPPLVCTAGWPNAAACVLLEGLRGAGAEIRYHGDFDWEGLRIHAWLREQVGVEPWRMDAASYRAAATAAPDTAPRLPVLNTPPSGVDPALVEAMRACGRVVPEELLLDVLLADLALAGERAGSGWSA
ncbi:MAG: TIGR02679 family protein, partial [Thermoleophilaceae bacterium]